MLTKCSKLTYLGGERQRNSTIRNMKARRILAEEAVGGVYHCMSRVVGATRLLDDDGKRRLVKLLGDLSAFCEVEILSYCIMSNHFHLLVRVPPSRPLETVTDAQILEKLESLHGKRAKVAVVARECVKGGLPIPEAVRQSVISRMWNLSAFMREFKLRFSRWYNGAKDRTGYFWGERFKSVLVEDSPEAIRAVAAYIDLNPVRAGMVDDPKEYPFCGYAAAEGGDRKFQEVISGYMGIKSWARAVSEYRSFLYVTGGRSGSSEKAAVSREAILAELKRGNRLEVGQVLRLHLRHMTDGGVLGSEDFVDETWERLRDRFGKNRKSGARPIRGVEIPGIMVMRDLQRDAIG